MQRRPRLRTVQVPTLIRRQCPSYLVFLEMKGIELLGGDMWGHRKDLDEYYTVENATIEEIRILWRLLERLPMMLQIRSRMDQKLSSDLIKYIAKTKITA